MGAMMNIVVYIEREEEKGVICFDFCKKHANGISNGKTNRLNWKTSTATSIRTCYGCVPLTLKQATNGSGCV